MTDSKTIQQVLNKKLETPIVLIGMMGVGKTTVGRMLAHRLGLIFNDSDRLIEARAGQSVSDIFDTFGERKFREAEHNVIASLLEQKTPSVIATGGGAICNPATLHLIQAHGLSVWLSADIDVLIKRVAKNQTRPLLKTTDPEATLRHIYQIREPLYKKADITFQVHHNSVDEAVNDLIQQLCTYLTK